MRLAGRCAHASVLRTCALTCPQNAFVFFASESEVARVLSRAAKFGAYVRGQRCPLYASSAKRQLFVANMPYQFRDDEQVTQLLRQIPDFPIEECTVDLAIDPRHDNRPRGFGFFTFETHEAALRAFMLLDGRRVANRRLKVRWGGSSKDRAAKMRSLDLTAQIKQLQATNYRLRLEKTELELRLQRLLDAGAVEPPSDATAAAVEAHAAVDAQPTRNANADKEDQQRVPPEP